MRRSARWVWCASNSTVSPRQSIQTTMSAASMTPISSTPISLNLSAPSTNGPAKSEAAPALIIPGKASSNSRNFFFFHLPSHRLPVPQNHVVLLLFSIPLLSRVIPSITSVSSSSLILSHHFLLLGYFFFFFVGSPFLFFDIIITA